MSGFICSMVGATFSVAAAAEVIRKKKSVIANGNAQIDTAQSKFGGSSLQTSSGSDALIVNAEGSDLTLAGDFTLEFWFRSSSPSSPSSQHLFSNTSGPITIQYDPGATNFIWYDTAARGLSNSISSNTWYHLAVVRSGTQIKGYINGTNTATWTYASSINFNTLYFGNRNNLSNPHNGHIDEIRISKSARYTANFTPSTTAFVNDDNTLLLIHANGTDGSTFFEDDNGVRAQASVIQGTAGASATQISTAQSKFGGSSLVFDGNYDWLNVGMPVAAGSGQFTFECWLRFDILPTSQTLDGGAYMMIYGNGAEPYLLVTNSQVSIGLSPNYKDYVIPTISINTWYHLALTRNSSNEINVFWDGVKKTATGGAFTSTANFCDFGMIGRFTTNDGRGSFDGYMDEIRVSNTCRYTANFTPATAPFVNDSNTLLLIHGDGTNASTVFRDDNGYSARVAKHISYYGNAQIDTAQSKFGGASALFDGTDDALQITDVSWINWNSDFTVELWIRMSQYGEQVFFDTREGSGGNGTGGYLVRDSSSVLRFYLNGTSIVSKSDPNITTNTWHHVAITRSGNNFNMWIDGTSVSSATSSATGTAYKFYIGRNSYSASSGNTVGHIDEFRFSNTARYTANFTAPTAPFQNDANTVLLLHFNGADAATTFVDDVGGRAAKGVTAIGNAQIDTAQSKFGGSSALFDGTNDHLRLSSGDINLGTGDFTIEFWVRTASVTGVEYLFVDQRSTQSEAAMCLGYGNTGSGSTLYLYVSGAYRISGVALTANTWQHVALSRSGTSTKMFLDGTQVGSTFTDTVNYLPNALRIGESYSDLGDFNGWIDELRISNTARYTANFTAPTAPFSNDSNTLLLLHMDGTDGSTVFIDDNGKIPVTA